MTFAPPVSRGEFHYNGNLYVEVGNLNRHERATVEDIMATLRPDLKKPKKGSIDPPKDQVGHWYEAQLMHYGLPPSKDKARAKMRLLEALNQSKLVVPPNIVKMEAEMKKEYAAAERKAKAQYKASMAPAMKSEPSVAGKKRKQSESSGNMNNINVNISLGNNFQGFPGAFNATDSQPPAKKAKTTPSKPTGKKPEETASPKPPKKNTKPEVQQPSPQAPPRPKQTARSSKLTEAWLKDPSLGPGPIDRTTGLHIPHPSTMTQGTAERKPTAAKKEPTIRKPSAVKPEPKVKKETSVKKEPGTQKETKPIKKEAKVKKEPSAAKPLSKIKRESITDNPPAPLGLINGIYTLSCPTVSQEWRSFHPDDDLTLTISLSGTTVWGAYDLGIFTGIIFLPNRPYQASPTTSFPFTYRGRETSEGQMSFGHGCDGEISFLGDGRIEGWIGVYGKCRFEGVRRAEAGTAVRSAGSMKGEWEGYNQKAYDEENSARW